MQTSVAFAQPLGVVGEIIIDGPQVSRPFTLVSADASYNVFGRAFTVSSEGVAQAGGTGVFAGILTGPKQHVHYGTAAGGPLAATLTLPNNVQAQLTTLSEGIVITVPGACAIGAQVIYDTTTGALSTVAADATEAGVGKAFVPNGRISDFTPSGAGLAVLRMTNGV